MEKSKTLKAQVEAHNQKVRMAFERVKLGEVICLTDLMISKELLEQEEMKHQELEPEIFTDEFDFEK